MSVETKNMATTRPVFMIYWVTLKKCTKR